MAATPFKVKAVFEYNSGHDDDLRFDLGQIITVTDVEDDDWYYGEYAEEEETTKQGLFPKNFVEKYEPVTPPRPSRPSRREQELDPQAQIKMLADPITRQAAAPRNSEHAEPVDVKEDGGYQREDGAPISTLSSKAVGSKSETSENERLPNQSTTPIPPQMAATATSEQAVKTGPTIHSNLKSPPPIVAEKPASSSFRDRIAAFNKPAAPPVAPIKPGQGSGSFFVKKPFIPPPPSRNAYVPIPKDPPPQKVYRREEDSDLPDPAEEEYRLVPPLLVNQAGEQDQPKPTSLKERIALLQKQQLEQAARHADAVTKKEKPKKPPPRKKIDALHEGDEEILTKTDAAGHAYSETEEDLSEVQRPTQVSKTRDRTPISRTDSLEREYMNDPNDADQSAGGDTEDSESTAIGIDHKAPANIPRSVPTARQHVQEDGKEHTTDTKPLAGDARELDVEGGAEDEDEEEVDPEIRRRMEIRERMAKMSGGMGMAGMFGPSGGLTPLGLKKSNTGSDSTKKREEDQVSSLPSLPSQPVPVMALPGMTMPSMTKVKTPEQQNIDDSDYEATKSSSRQESEMVSEEEEHHAEADVNSSGPLPLPPTGMASDSTSAANLRSPERSVRAPPASRALPPIPTIPANSDVRAAQLSAPPNSYSQFPSPGQGSNDKISTVQESETPSLITPKYSIQQPLPVSIPVSPPMSGSETVPISPISSPISPKIVKSSTFPHDAIGTSEKGTNQPPPVPGAFLPILSPPRIVRAPPPLPQTIDTNDTTGKHTSDNIREDSEEITEYEGDYDTDIAAGDSHKDALTANQGSSADETLTGDEASYHHSGLPSIGPPPSLPGAFAPRGAPPPPPPREPPRTSRQSSDLPRAPPPLPTQAPSRSRQSNDLPRGNPPPIPHQASQMDGEYDPYSYIARPSVPSRPSYRSVEMPTAEDQMDDLYNSSPPRMARATMPESPSIVPPPLPKLVSQNLATTTRQSLDTPRAIPSHTSMDAKSPADHTTGYMAHEIDIGRSSHWWTQRKMPPPSLQNRFDIVYEIEESTAIQQNGSQLTIKYVYILFMDYSQTILSAQYSLVDSSDAEFSQRLEAPPVQLRQDQLEAAHDKFGARIAEKANQLVNHAVGNGTPIALISELLQRFPDAVPAVGIRAFGATVYANMANATVQQFDEIRTGDIISFRNTKMQGHRGPVKQKYNIDVGRPDHVAIVVDWDGTKKKIRAWEQGRESKKVRIESFKLGDIKSGEVKIWRVVGRDWIGWGNKS